MKRSALLAIVLAGGIAALGGGCRGVDRTESITIPNPVVVTPERPLADVPVPVGFAFKSTGSYIFDGNYRVARLLYRGTPHVEEVIQYFKEQMPQSRWMFVRDSGVDGRVLLFHNDCEELELKLDRQSGITALQIDIKPRRV
jgi:hypothetical protein